MKIVKNAVTIGMSLIFAVVFGLSCLAQTAEGPKNFQPREKKAQEFEKIAQELNLTAEQRQAMKEHRSQNSEQVRGIRKHLQEVRAQLRNELDKPDTDIAKIKGLATELKEVEAQMIDQHIKQVLEMKKILTPQQYQLLNQKIQDRVKKDRPQHFKGPKCVKPDAPDRD